MSSVTVRRQPPMARPRSLLTLPHLRAWRTWRNLRQTDLATKAGVSPPTVVRAEAGDAVTPLSAQRLARALDVAVTQLREEPPPDEMRWLERRRADKDEPGGDS